MMKTGAIKRIPWKTKKLLAILFASSVSALAADPTTPRLQLELVKTEPIPVIGENHPDVKDIPAELGVGSQILTVCAKC